MNPADIDRAAALLDQADLLIVAAGFISTVPRHPVRASPCSGIGASGWRMASASSPATRILGAGTAIPSVRHFGQAVVTHHNGRMIRINPREPQVGSARDVGLAANALKALTAIARLRSS